MLSKKAECSRPFGKDSGSIQPQIIFMYKILSFGRSCKAYLRIYKDSGPDITLCCESCGHRLHKHGRYYRYVAGKTEYLRIPIYRWLCPKCGTTVSLLPDFLAPWARCATWIREGAIKRKQRGHSFRRIAETVISPRIGLSPRTIKRWWRQQLARAADASLWQPGNWCGSDAKQTCCACFLTRYLQTQRTYGSGLPNFSNTTPQDHHV